MTQPGVRHSPKWEPPECKSHSSICFHSLQLLCRGNTACHSSTCSAPCSLRGIAALYNSLNIALAILMELCLSSGQKTPPINNCPLFAANHSHYAPALSAQSHSTHPIRQNSQNLAHGFSLYLCALRRGIYTWAVCFYAITLFLSFALSTHSAKYGKLSFGVFETAAVGGKKKVFCKRCYTSF